MVWFFREISNGCQRGTDQSMASVGESKKSSKKKQGDSGNGKDVWSKMRGRKDVWSRLSLLQTDVKLFFGKSWRESEAHPPVRSAFSIARHLKAVNNDDMKKWADKASLNNSTLAKMNKAYRAAKKCNLDTKPLKLNHKT
jgi:hypothetical protein